MAVTWTIATLERNTDDGVVVAHWRASDSEVVGAGDDAVTHSGSSYGTASFTPDADAEGYVPYADLTEETVVGWVKDQLTAEKVTEIEAALQAQLDEQAAPTKASGTPWS